MSVWRYKNKERVSVVEEIKDDGRNKMPIRITVEKVKPVFGSDGKRRKGRTRVEVLISKGRGKLSLRVEEVSSLISMLQQIQDGAVEAHKRCSELQSASGRLNN